MSDAVAIRAADAVRRDVPDSGAYAWYVLIILLGLYMMNYADRYLAAGLLGPIKADFGASDAFLGFLIGPAFAIFYTVAAVPIARYADRAARIRIIAAGALIWSCFTMLSGLAPDAWSFAAARVGVGLGEAAFLAPAYSLLSDYFPPRRRALAFGVMSLGVYLGQLLGLIGGGAIAEASHWRNAFVLLGIPGVLLALTALVTVREPRRGRLDHVPVAPAPPMRFVEVVRVLSALASYRHILIGSALGGFGGMAFGMWGPTLFVRAFDLPLAEANARFGIAFGMSGLAGALACGWLSDRLSVHGASARLRLGGFALTSNTIVM
ncbi:MAG: MFS transporter, partial [Sphingomonadaceae bacterium]